VNDSGTSLAGDAALSPAAAGLYARMAAGEHPAPGDEETLDELVGWGLVSADPDRPDRPVVLDPRKVVRDQARAQISALARKAAELSKLPELSDELAAHYYRGRGPQGAGCEYLDDPTVVNARIGAALAGARKEMLTAQPGGPRNRKLLDLAVERDAKALSRGVQVRTLYRDAVRADAVTREWATVMTGMGVQFRTIGAPFLRCIVIDRQHAFIDDYVTDDGPAHAAWYVKDPGMVAWIVAVFDEVWRRGESWSGGVRAVGYGLMAGAGQRTTRMQREILRDTCEGIMQETTAARLGISVRKIVTELHTLRTMFGAPTTTALAFKWASNPERLIDNEPFSLDRGDVTPAA
jgi:DNA-binding CsgD family transcriptional regulator